MRYRNMYVESISVDVGEEYWLIKLNVLIYLSKNKARQLQYLND